MTSVRHALAGALLSAFLLLVSSPAAQAAVDKPAPTPEMLRGASAVPKVAFGKLDLNALATEDTIRDELGGPKRFAVAREVDITPAGSGAWDQLADGRLMWRLQVDAAEAVHLNFGFGKFDLPAGAELLITTPDGHFSVGPFTNDDELAHGQLWTQVLPGSQALLILTTPAAVSQDVVLNLTSINQGYRGFGFSSKACKSGACNTDVACLSAGDPWNNPRRSVGAYTRGGTDTCTGSLVNNTSNDRRMLFITATHCGISSANVGTVLVYWNYESPTCRRPGSSESGTPLPKPSTTTPGLTFLAATNNPFAGSGAADTRSDTTLIELATPAPNNPFNLHWAGWDRRPPPTTCSAPADPASTAGLCASIHHPGVDEKRITFVEVPMTLDSISGATNVHWQANWDPTIPVLPNYPPGGALTPSVTEPGSSGSPLYSAQQRLVGVLSGGPSACGATGASLRDQYGGLFHAWEGIGTPATRMRDYLDPTNTGVETIDGVNACTPLAPPAGVTATANGDNQIDVTWSPVGGATGYRIYRSTGACPGSGFAQIGEVAGTLFSDTTVSGGVTYSYRVTTLDAQPCESAQSTCDDAAATGTCALPPTFAGATSATSAQTASCAINVNWNAGASSCGGAANDLVYNVYRSTTPGFTPGAGNLLQACVDATTYADTAVASGTPYHYIVRAEDPAGSGTGACAMGATESNIVQRTATPTGPGSTLISDNVESGNTLWSVSGTGTGGANFAIVSTQSNSPSNSWFAPDPAVVTDRQLALTAAITPTPGSTLSFFQRVQLENTFDGAVLEYSLDGTTWTDILLGQGAVPANANRFLEGAYPAGTISTQYMNPIGGRRAWTGTTVTTWQRVRVDLADFAGVSMRFRFRVGTDSSVAAGGYWVDDIEVVAPVACGLTNPELTTDKTAVLNTDNGTVGQADAGDVITYTVTVTNSGDVELGGLAVSDVFEGQPATTLSCSPTTLSPSQTATCSTYQHTVTAAEVAAGGSLDNTATAQATPTGGGSAVQDDDSATVAIAPAPALSVDKSASLTTDNGSAGDADAGDVITYIVTVLNSGNVIVDNLVVSDVFEGQPATTLSCSPTTLLPNQTANCMAYLHTVTQAEVDAGLSLDNTATAQATPVGGGSAVQAADSVSVPVVAAAAALTVDKTAVLQDGDADTLADAGEAIRYGFTVVNTGNVTLTTVRVLDPLLGGSPIACAPATLAPAATATCGPVDYTVTTADLDAPSVNNSAQAQAEAPAGGTVTSAADTTSTPTDQPDAVFANGFEG